jgi:hypothetical protein
MDNIFKIWHGDGKTLALIYKTCPGNGRQDFTGYTEIKVRIPLSSGQSSTYKEYTLSNSGGVVIDPSTPKLGRILVTILPTDSPTFNPGEAQDIETVIIGADSIPVTVKFYKALYVYKSITEPAS